MRRNHSIQDSFLLDSYQTITEPVRRNKSGLDYVIIQGDDARRRLPGLAPPPLPTKLDPH